MTGFDLYVWRVTRRLSQAALAARLGVSQRTISNWEAIKPPSDIAERLLALPVDLRAMPFTRRASDI